MRKVLDPTGLPETSEAETSAQKPSLSDEQLVRDPRTALTLLLMMTKGEPVCVPTGMLHRRDTTHVPLASVQAYEVLVADRPKNLQIIDGYLINMCNRALREVLVSQS